MVVNSKKLNSIVPQGSLVKVYAKRLTLILMLITACVSSGMGTIKAYADGLPEGEVEAISLYPNWVGVCGEISGTGSPAAGDTTAPTGAAPEVNITTNGNKINPAAPIIQDLLKAEAATGVPASVLLAQGAYESGDAGWWNKARVDDAAAQKYSYFNGGDKKSLNLQFSSYDNNPNGHGPMQLDNWPGNYTGSTGNYNNARFDKFERYAKAQFGAPDSLDAKKIGNIAMMFDTSILFAAVIDAELLPNGVTPKNATSAQWAEVLDDYGTLRGASAATKDSWKKLADDIKAQLGGATASGGSASCCAGGGQTGTQLSGNGIGEQVFNYFISKGFSNESAAAATGNLQLESANFTVIDGWGGGGGNYYGLAQWDRTNRYAALVRFAGSTANAAKLNTQLDFVWHELHNGYGSVLQKLKGSSSLDDKTIYWGRVYEGAITNGALQMQRERLVYAHHWASRPASGGSTPQTPADATTQTDICQGAGSSGQAFIAGDYAWPVDIKKSEVFSGYSWPCSGSCHHDGSYAFDLTTKLTGTKNKDQDSVGRDIYAITDGTVESMHIYDGIAGCYSMEFRSSSDGYVYWYGHMRKPTVHAGAKVKVGQKVAEIGERKCTGNGSYPHLHIDRGSPKGSPGGYVDHRDQGINTVINKLYEGLPN